MAILLLDIILFASERFLGRVTKSLVNLDMAHIRLCGLLEIFGMLSSSAPTPRGLHPETQLLTIKKAPLLYCPKSLH